MANEPETGIMEGELGEIMDNSNAEAEGVGVAGGGALEGHVLEEGLLRGMSWRRVRWERRRLQVCSKWEENAAWKWRRMRMMSLSRKGTGNPPIWVPPHQDPLPDSFLCL